MIRRQIVFACLCLPPSQALENSGRKQTEINYLEEPDDERSPATQIGRTPIEDRYWAHPRGIRVMFRPGEYDDLCQIAEGWGVPMATAVWGIVGDQLARIWKRAPE
jgi:hypothetical protein